MLQVANGAKIAPKFGFSSVNINGLIVHTLTLRVRKHSLNHMAFWYVTNVENVNQPISMSDRPNKKGYWYVTYRYATTSYEEYQNLVKLLVTAQGYVHQHKADQKLGTKTAPDFIGFYNGHNDTNSCVVDDLPF